MAFQNSGPRTPAPMNKPAQPLRSLLPFTRTTGLGVAFAALLVPGLSASAITVYDESVSGDFADVGTSPTLVKDLASGSNHVLGATGNGSPGNFRDYFTFTVPAGLEWVALDVLSGATTRAVGFIGLQAGNQVTLPTFPPDATGLLGWHHLAPSDVGSDLLPILATSGNGSSGFVAPLPAGDYAVWIQDSSTGNFPYGLNIELAPVPEAGPGLVGAAGVLALFLARRWTVSNAPARS